MAQKNNLLKILFIIILFLSFIKIGNFKLGEIPTLNQDEMSFALGAVNISNTGYDLCDNKFPLLPCDLKIFPFKATTISYYLSALFYKFYTPDSIFNIRILSVFIGALTGIFSLLFFYKLLHNSKNGLVYAVTLSIIFYFSFGVFTIQRFGAPYFILSVLLQMILFYLIYEFHRINKKILLFFIPLTATLLMLDYQLYRFFAPFFLLLFIILFKNKIFIKPQWQKNNNSLLSKIKAILSENKYFIAGISIFSGTFLIILHQIIIDKFTTEYYFTEKSFSLFKFLADYLFHFSPFLFYFYYNLNFFFFLNNYGLFPVLSAIFFIFGLIWIVKNFWQNNFFKFLLISFLAYPIPSALLGIEKFASNRLINLIPIYFIITVYGICAFQAYADHYKKTILYLKNFPPFVLLPIFWLVIIIFQNFYSVYDYFYIMPRWFSACEFESNHGRNCNFTGLFHYLKNENGNYNKIYLDDDLLFISSYADFFNEITRYSINNYDTINIDPKNNFIKNSIIVISKTKADKLNLEKKYKLIKAINEPGKKEKFFYVFLVDR